MKVLEIVKDCTVSHPGMIDSTFDIGDSVAPNSPFYWPLLWSGFAVETEVESSDSTPLYSFRAMVQVLSQLVSQSGMSMEEAFDNILQSLSGPAGPRVLVRSDVAGAYAYMGTAPVGLADADDGWTVARIHLTGHTTTTGAGAWGDRLTLTYT